MYAALTASVVVDRLTEIARERAENFATQAQPLRKMLSDLPGTLRGRQTFVDLALAGCGKTHIF
jgi:hypothetical protein